MRWRKAATAPFRLVGSGLKAFAMRWGGQARSWWSVLLPRTRFDYAREVDESSSSILQAVTNWIARTFPEAPVVVMDEKPDGTREKIVGHGIPRLIEKPNPFYSGVLLWMATVADWVFSSNAYWLKVRSRADRVVQLWWAPSSTMEPRWPDDGQTFISHYEYRPDPARDAIKVDPRDVVHFRYGMDSQNVRKGMNQLRALLLELFTDHEAALYTATLMRNLGTPSVILAPEETTFKVSKEDAKQIKDEFKATFGGDKRGDPMVMSRPTKVQKFSFSPDEMNLRDLRRVPEERVTAVFGVAAVVVGLGAGLDRSTFQNFAEAREAAYEGNIIPTQRLMAADLRTQLLPDFDENSAHDVEFDLTRVRVLQPDMDKLFERMNKAVNGGWAMEADARRAVGLPVEPEHYRYLRPMHIVEVPAKSSSAKSLRGGDGLKSNGAFSAQMAQGRTRLVGRFRGDIAEFFEGQAGRVKERLSGLLRARKSDGRKQLEASYLLPSSEDELLGTALQPLWLLGIEQGWDVAGRTFGLEGEFSPEDPLVIAALTGAAARAQRINDGTRASLTKALEIAAERGYTLQQIVDGVADDDFMGLTDRTESYYENRPEIITTTEATWATNSGTVALYQKAGLEQLMVEDNPACELCAPRNGTIISVAAGMANANPTHPNCIVTLVPA